MVKIVQKQDLNQKFSPQQILQANLFQLNSFALEQRLYQELEKNPLLELSEPDIEDELKDQELEDSEDFEIDELYSNTDDFELGGGQSGVDKDMMENSELSKADIVDELKDQLSTFRDEVMSSLETNPRFSDMIALFSQQVMQFEMSRNQVIPAQHMQLFYLKLEIFAKLKATYIPLEDPVLLVLQTIDELLDQFEVTSDDIYIATAQWEHLKESHRERSCCVM